MVSHRAGRHGETSGEVAGAGRGVQGQQQPGPGPADQSGQRVRSGDGLLFAPQGGGAVAGAEGLIVAYAGERRFGPGWYAVLMGCLPVGMLVGDLLVGRFLRPRARERLVVALAGLPQDGRGQAFGLLGSGSMTLQGVGPVCMGAVAAVTGTGGAIALASGAAVLTAGWILTWHPRLPGPRAEPSRLLRMRPHSDENEAA